MYAAAYDPYCYRGTSVLKNRLRTRNPDHLAAFEAEMVASRFDEALPAGRLSMSHYRAIHRHLFQDVYAWAGRFRTVRISKGGSTFAYPEHVPEAMRRLFAWLRMQRHLRGRPPERFAAEAAHFLAELNAIHPFREGNGRTQSTFFALLAADAGHPLDLGRFIPNRFLAAMIASFRDDEAMLAAEIRSLIA